MHTPPVRWNVDKKHRCPRCHTVVIQSMLPRSHRRYQCCRCGTIFTRWPKISWLWRLYPCNECYVNKGPTPYRDRIAFTLCCWVLSYVASDAYRTRLLRLEKIALDRVEWMLDEQTGRTDQNNEPDEKA